MVDSQTIQFNTPGAPENTAGNSSFSKSTLVPALVVLLVIVGGIGTGWTISKGDILGAKQEAAAPGAEVSSGGKEVGIDDAKTFRDSAQGVLEEGGIDGEGTHKLVRDGGPSQTVYLTSSVVDLDQFAGKKIEVWGETLGSKKAGWLMDVGRVKVLE